MAQLGDSTAVKAQVSGAAHERLVGQATGAPPASLTHLASALPPAGPAWICFVAL
jgi:hypothetical protein